jgi:hypothetical protein
LHDYDNEQTKVMSQIKMFSQNEDRSLILTPKTSSRPSFLIRNFTGTNLLDTMMILSNT